MIPTAMGENFYLTRFVWIPHAAREDFLSHWWIGLTEYGWTGFPDIMGDGAFHYGRWNF